MDNTEKARELINKHLYLHGGDGLGITDGDVYRAVLGAVSEALNIPVVSITLNEITIAPEKYILDDKGKCIRIEKPPFN